MSDVLLSIAIPTFNRAEWLQLCLTQLLPQVTAAGSSVEVTIYDNASPDNTPQVVQSFIEQGFSLSYTRNVENIGPDKNFAQCFNLARGKYVLILGDDDLFVDKALSSLLDQLKSEKYGVVCMRPYGFDNDFRLEHPGAGGSEKVFHDAGLYLAAIASLMTLISSCVIHKSILKDVDASEFCGENLVQVHLVIRAALASDQNLFLNKYLIACKRNNSGGYDFSKVFVENLGSILDSYQGPELSKKAILAIETRLMIGYFPYYLFKQRLVGSGDILATYDRFHKRYKGRWCFYLWIYPILKLPRTFAIMWGGMATIIGRVINGDLQRGVSFAVNKVFR